MISAAKKLLKVAIIGAPNAGKSTLLNRLIRSEVSCVSNKVHTTQQNVLGVYTEDLTQIEFYDSPGVVAREHMHKHQLEPSMLTDPSKAATICDIITVIVDASNIREQKRLNKGILEVLRRHEDKPSILVLNKIDLIPEKRLLLDISTRLTQGCLQHKIQFDLAKMSQLSDLELKKLNIIHHLRSPLELDNQKAARPKHRHVIELGGSNLIEGPPEHRWRDIDPHSISYPNFSDVFLISAREDDGVDKLRGHLMSLAQPVETWPHSADYLSNLSAREIIHALIRGKVFDKVPHAIPYLLEFKYSRVEADENSNLHVNLIIKCPERYMVGKVIGERGETIFQIIADAREAISRVLGCDVKLVIEVKAKKKKKE